MRTSSLSFFRQQIYNGLWPTTWENLLAAWSVVSLMMSIDHPKLNYISHYLWLFGDYLYLDDSYPYFLRIFFISLITSVVYFIIQLYTRQYMLRVLLSYKGWLCKYCLLMKCFLLEPHSCISCISPMELALIVRQRLHECLLQGDMRIT